MEYPHAKAFLKSQITINANPFFEPIAKPLLINVASLPCHYHKSSFIKF